jgi:hypothetical protein
MYPLESGDAEAAFAAGMSAASELQSHTQSLISGLGSPGGDPMTAVPTLEPDLPGLVAREPEGAGDG